MGEKSHAAILEGVSVCRSILGVLIYIYFCVYYFYSSKINNHRSSLKGWNDNSGHVLQPISPPQIPRRASSDLTVRRVRLVNEILAICIAQRIGAIVVHFVIRQRHAVVHG